jgi:RNA methyltransferase, TrmH family
MFPLAKLRELSPRTRMRKIARILQGLEVELSTGGTPDPAYVSSLLRLLEPPAAAGTLDQAGAAARLLDAGAASPELLRALNAVRHGLLRSLDAEPSEWDLVSPETGTLDRSGLRAHPVTVYLEDIRSPFNVGSIFRTAEAFGARGVILSPRTPAPTHPRARKTARGADQALGWEVRELDEVADRPGIFALELGGTPLARFRFPSEGMVLLGSEELGLSPEALRLADAGQGRVSIPLAGAKRSLNVSVAFGILMQAWHAALSADADGQPPRAARPVGG